MSAEDCLFLNGSYGVGKSATLDHLADLYAEHGLPFALFDVDWFHRSWPTAVDDPRNLRTEARNIAAVWRTYRETGPRTPIVAGVLESASDIERHEATFERPVRVVLLTASRPVVEQRLRGRYDVSRTAALDWHLADLDRVTSAIADVPAELVIDTDERSPREVARVVFEHVARDLGVA